MAFGPAAHHSHTARADRRCTWRGSGRTQCVLFIDQEWNTTVLIASSLVSYNHIILWTPAIMIKDDCSHKWNRKRGRWQKSKYRKSPDELTVGVPNPFCLHSFFLAPLCPFFFILPLHTHLFSPVINEQEAGSYSILLDASQLSNENKKNLSMSCKYQMLYLLCECSVNNH